MNPPLNKRKFFFDNVESHPLTEEQRLAVLRNNDKNMVLAAAGTGKTSVMVAKALDLIDRGLAKPSEILVLAYNKSAAEELKHRLDEKSLNSNIKLKETPDISTFHSLGRRLLKDAGISTYMSVFTEDCFKFQEWVKSWLRQYLSENPNRLIEFISLFPEPTTSFDFTDKESYERYIRDNEFRTLKGDLVKGYQELVIANWLTLHQIPYEYEEPYVSKRRIEVGFDYRPDFHISNSDVYIEHFGISRDGSTRTDIDSVSYNKSMQEKRELHDECGTTLVETYHYDWVEGALEKRLEQGLKDVGIAPEEGAVNETIEQYLEKLETTNDKSPSILDEWTKILTKSLQAIRFERLDEPEILQRLKSAKISKAKVKTKILSSLQEAYIKELLESERIDFDDMIIRAIEVINHRNVDVNWKYILVDEFQDISSSRMELVQSLIRTGRSPSLTVVGDDWQSIYRFSGGKLELTTRFNELVGSHTLTKLQKTFRYNNSIADTAGTFIMENPEQYQKHIETHDTVSEPHVYLLDDRSLDERVKDNNGLYYRVRDIIKKIRTNDKTGSIAVIARYNYLLNDSKRILESEGKNVYFWSFHKSKGLEADYCILIGFFQGKTGFPNQNKDDVIPEALLPTLDSYPHSEERRLLYVGITRAKKKSYIVASPTAPSEFVLELLAPKYKVNIFSSTFQERHRKIFKCPNCSNGYLRMVNGRYGNFYSCSTGRGCSVGKARVCEECGAPSIDTRNESKCNNQDCRHSFKICEKCGRPMKIRKGKFGKFWGCSGYGITNDQCKNTAKIP